MDPILNELCKAANEVDPHLDLPLLEPYLSKILDHIIAHPEKRKDAVEKFIDIMNGEDFGMEIVAYCMQELRWPEILAECQRINADPNYCRRRIMRIWDILNVYSDRWDNAEIFYKRFKKK